jgi:hypothetical protein
MIRRRHVVLGGLLSIAALAVLASGCTDSPVGRKCDLGVQTPQPNAVVVASLSLDCVSRTCLRYPPARELPPGSIPLAANAGLCTAECSSSDDCDRVPESPCVLGFTCGIAVTAGPYCCRKFCICRDYVVVPESDEIEVPAECNPAESKNACCNLDGRSGNPSYPLCK